MPAFRRRPLRPVVTPPVPQLNWGHPLLADGRLVRALTYSDHQPSGTLRDLVLDSLVTQNATSVEDSVGPVARATGSSNAGYWPDAPDLTPTTSVGNGGWTIAAGIWYPSAGATNQLCHKYQGGGLEWVSGLLGGTWYYWIYGAGYIGRTAPEPSAGQWHDVCACWDGSASGTAGVSLWCDALRIDTGDFSTGSITPVANTGTDAMVGGSNPGLGGTSDLRVRYCYLFRRGLLPDEIALLHADPWCVLLPAGERRVGQGAAPAGGLVGTGFFGF